MPARLLNACMLRRAYRRSCRSLSAGFTLLELLVVLAIMAVATAGVSLALRDSSQTALEREAQRLAVLFESARALSRATGAEVYWHTTPDGFKFEGLPADAVPSHWLTSGMVLREDKRVQLGPEPIIGPQFVDVVASASLGQPERSLRVATDGLRPFSVQATVQP